MPAGKGLFALSYRRGGQSCEGQKPLLLDVAYGWRHGTKTSLLQGRRTPNLHQPCLLRAPEPPSPPEVAGLGHTCSEPGGSVSWLRVSILRGDVGTSGKRSAGPSAELLGLQESSSGPADSSW